MGSSMRKTYSICVANRNSMNTVRLWASSLLANLSEDDEVIIVDGNSTDGSDDFLGQLSRDHGFEFITARTNIGQARQLALMRSKGEYVISQVDTDDAVVSLKEAKRLYHEVIEHDPVTGAQRAFMCPDFFIIPRRMLLEIGGFPDLAFYEDQLVYYRLANLGQLTGSWKVSAVVRRVDPKKRRFLFRISRTLVVIRDGLRLGFFDARNPQGLLLLLPGWLASLPMTHYDFRWDWWNLDVQRDEHILSWINRERLGPKLLLEEIEKACPAEAAT